MPANFESIEEAVKAIKTTTIVTCPLNPIEIAGVTAAAYIANDCIGTVFKIRVPKRGEIRSATFFNLSDVTNQTDIVIFRRTIASAGDNAAYSPSDAEILHKITSLNFVVSDDDINSRTFEINNIGKGYTAPEGFFYIQAVDRTGQTLVAGNIPRLQIQIQSFDSEFVEG